MNRSTEQNRLQNMLKNTLLTILLCAGLLNAQMITGASQEISDPGKLAVAFHQQQRTKASDPVSPEGVTAIDNRTLSGQTANNQFGYSVAGAGDVNGDGFSDVIVGARNYASNSGRAYIYFGGLNMNSVADIVLNGTGTNYYFGTSVAGAGDLNGDGYSDVVVGESGNSGNIGVAYVYFGGQNMNTVADVALGGPLSVTYFGSSVSSAGDVNGDGYADVIVGGYGYSSSTGQAYVFYGGAVMNGNADVTMTGETTGNKFGISVSTAGDVNGDGYADVIVGAEGYSSSAGKAYLYLGGASMNNIVDQSLFGETGGNYFGNTVSTAGDVNGDGYADVIIGAYSYNVGMGRVYIYFGGASMNNVADVTMTGPVAGGAFGSSVSCAGDMNGDGFSDVIVGAYNLASNGRAFVYFGGTVMDNIIDKAFTGTLSGSNFGAAVCSAGDVNGNGYADIIVGAFGTAATTGQAFVFENALNGKDIPDEKFVGEVSFPEFGKSVASAGDVNGDGYDDIIIGAVYEGSYAGRAYIYFGGPGADNTADLTLNGEGTTQKFGGSVASAGDVNGDGFDDVIVGSREYNFAQGRAYIYYGGASMNNVADVYLTGESSSNYFGCSVASAGDVNGDGFSDVVVGAEGYFTNSGRAYIFYGAVTMNSTSDVTLNGETTGNFFGTSVSSAGDVNKDGFDDVIVGAYGANSLAGRTYLFLGSASMNNSADQTFNGEGAADYFGASVSSAGDVNGDGYSDILVGAWANGTAYLFLGGFSMDALSDRTFSGEAGTVFGDCVASGGDVNNDGYADMLISAPNYASGIGRTYLYFGGRIPDSIYDVVYTGETAASWFGTSAASAGDINGDGCSDIIIGAYATSFGSVFLYRSTSPPIVPRISAVNDVPHDQGGIVNVRWYRSAYDATGISSVTGYRIERSLPPGFGGFAWNTIASVQATHNPQYSYSASTQYDSATGTQGTFFFRITAVTANIEEYWRSNIISGHSVDNLPPAGTGGIIAAMSDGSISLHWNPNTKDEDLAGYRLFRSTITGFIPSQSNLILSTSDTVYHDLNTIHGQSYFYRIKTVDVHGNESVSSPELSTVALSVELVSFTALPQGNRVELRWKTATETNNHGFEVERKLVSRPGGQARFMSQVSEIQSSNLNHETSNSDWTRLAFVEGSGTSNAPREYSFTDRAVSAGTYAFRLKQIDRDGQFSYSPEVQVTAGVAPKEFILSQNYPNPFNPTTNIDFAVPVTGRAELKIYSTLGTEVATLFTGDASAGEYHHVVFDARNLSSGIYIARLTFGNQTLSKKITLLK